MSARFRPTLLSQSTPIGLDRVGHRKLHRVLSGEQSVSEESLDLSVRLVNLFLNNCVWSDGMSECSATLDDSVSEEEEDASFDELADGTPYLQPGVELSVLNEVRDIHNPEMQNFLPVGNFCSLSHSLRHSPWTAV